MVVLSDAAKIVLQQKYQAELLSMGLKDYKYMGQAEVIKEENKCRTKQMLNCLNL